MQLASLALLVLTAVFVAVALPNGGGPYDGRIVWGVALAVAWVCGVSLRRHARLFASATR
ncbi:MAG TPA: hypothetical protein VG755_16670 [Nannocystaceae bacterium]|nr:hypothetical protein [Nannocystaceae bacterium]